MQHSCLVPKYNSYAQWPFPDQESITAASKTPQKNCISFGSTVPETQKPNYDTGPYTTQVTPAINVLFATVESCCWGGWRGGGKTAT